MKKPKKRKSSSSDSSLKELLIQREELERRVESEYTKILTVMVMGMTGSAEFYESHGDLSVRMLLEKQNRILDPILSRHQGKIVKEVEDGMLIIFNQPEEGILAAMEAERALTEWNEGKEKKEQIHLRIGIHHGKVILDGDDVYGLTVTAATRLQFTAKEDQILISHAVYREIGIHEEILCRPVTPVPIKGMEKPLQAYQISREKMKESVPLGRRNFPKQRNVFVLECSKEGNRIKISGYEKSGGEQKTVRHYEEVAVDEDKIREYDARIIQLLNRATTKGQVTKDILNELKTTGQLLYDVLLSVKVKEKLASTTSADLMISIDDHLVNIPWELLHDGHSFFCLRFNMGRLVRTRQTISEGAHRHVGRPLKMFVIADPQGNLESAYREGYTLRDKLEEREETVQIDIKSTRVRSTHVLGGIRNYDILHYAGHADYDTKNPSDSGFLMEDGKLKASDVIQLIGPTPLPSLVFSNACKSGHTDKWKVEEAYETNIYGLANAFLLAGVRHYIGTFWDVQDEPGLHFAIDFYNELMDGAMVGEALRKARLKLIERYGEDRLIWASYVIYGDPTFRYADLSRFEDAGPEQTGKAAKDEEWSMVRGSVRAAEEVVTLPSNRSKRIWMGSTLFLFLALLTSFFVLRSQESPPPVLPSVQHGDESPEMKAERIDELVAALIETYEKGAEEGDEKIGDLWKWSPPTLVFLNVRASGMTGAEKDFILSRMTDTLQRSKRAKVVEREVLAKLLEELKLSSSELADPATALRIGKIVSARIISTGSMVKQGNDWQISLRMIETETTAIKAAISESLNTEEIQEVADRLSSEIAKRLHIEYPLQGRILSLIDDQVLLDIGSAQGAAAGLRMEVLWDDTENARQARAGIGELEITSVEEERSYASVRSGKDGLKIGHRVREKM